MPYMHSLVRDAAVPVFGVPVPGASVLGVSVLGVSAYGATAYGATAYGATAYGATAYGATAYGATAYGATACAATASSAPSLPPASPLTPRRPSPPRRQTRPHGASRRWQQGFTLVEIAIVAAIVLIAAILGIPAINGYIIENKVPSVGQELQRFVARSKSSTQGLGPAPYAGVGMAQLANGLRSSSVLTVNGLGANASVRHGLGATDGDVVLSPGTITSNGDAFVLTLSRVNEAACPGLAAVMQRVSERIVINGTTVKEPSTGGAMGIYDATGAEAVCTAGDSNRFAFTAR